jgi:hypothetical protein
MRWSIVCESPSGLHPSCGVTELDLTVSQELYRGADLIHRDQAIEADTMPRRKSGSAHLDCGLSHSSAEY